MSHCQCVNNAHYVLVKMNLILIFYLKVQIIKCDKKVLPGIEPELDTKSDGFQNNVRAPTALQHQ